ncbi:hypothetical protein [Halobaculum sp. MBLA0143]|uniref:hypothetical protein n=1 Tax=Halobaculum sp. MBLA0143 TaxID=3079933 RepID=UPI00352428C5
MNAKAVSALFAAAAVTATLGAGVLWSPSPIDRRLAEPYGLTADTLVVVILLAVLLAVAVAVTRERRR